MERKKILIACDSPRSLIDFRGKLIESLIRSHEVCVFTPKIIRRDIRSSLEKLNVQIFETDLNPSNISYLADVRYILDLHRVIRSLRPDVFFPYAFKPVIYGSILAKYCKVPLITPMLTGLGNSYLPMGKRVTLVQLITRSLLKLSLRPIRNLRLILQNKDDYSTLINEKTISEKNIAYIVNGSGVDLFYYEYSEPMCKEISFLMISRLINAKGIREFYEAAKIVKGKFPYVNFKLIGPYEDNIDSVDEKLFIKIKDDGVIDYLGLIQDVRPVIFESSVVVLPSYYGEGIPRSILEAMAMGRAVITTNSVGCKETVNSDPKKINGFLVPVKNISQLVCKMEYFIKYPHDVKRFGRNGRNYAAEKFNVEVINKEIEEILLTPICVDVPDHSHLKTVNM